MPRSLFHGAMFERMNRIVSSSRFQIRPGFGLRSTNAISPCERKRCCQRPAPRRLYHISCQLPGQF